MCLCHLLSCLHACVYVFFRNKIESYNRYTCNMQETWKSMLQPELASLLSRSLSFFRACLHVCLLQQEWSKSRLSVRLQGRLHSSFNICNTLKRILQCFSFFIMPPSCFTSVSPLNFWQVFTQIWAALGYWTVHLYFGNALNPRLYPLPSPQIELLPAITTCCIE